ncbi:Mom family adenine methylcarbamoylation protein [Desulfovibrio desulfuricans]|uniref:Mom family adenine methylcarbamoylation protein n=1 Tax=Desulfovibrio TaxID=872 RepID=UPI003FA1B2B9
MAAHLKSGQREEYLRDNFHRTTVYKLRQFRYVRFLKTNWQRRLRLPIEPYPKPEVMC